MSALWLLIVPGLWALLLVACEVSVTFSMRTFANDDPAWRVVARRRLRRAFWNGVTSIGNIAPPVRK